MICQLFNNPKSFQIISDYLILTSLGRSVSNPTCTAGVPMGGDTGRQSHVFRKLI